MKYILIIILSIFFISSCRKQSDSFNTTTLSSYYPLSVGKYITYNLDSTLFINFGQKDTVIHYQAQDRVDDTITDNLNRKGYRIIRFLRSDPGKDWIPNNTFLIILTNNTIESIEDNLRFQKLKLPFRLGFTWKGNSFIDTYSLNSDVKYLDNWDYTYDSIDVPLVLNSIKIDSSIQVTQRDEFLGQDPHITGTQYAEKNYSIEKYGKNIGLIYKEFLHWEYQGSQPSRPAYYTGYGIKLSIIDHN